MRNLKKILALVLALVMSLSLMATAGAADFTDKADIKEDYQAAVNVLNGLNVFRGYENGTFQPKGDITRAEVATIIYRIDTADVEDTQAGIYTTWGKFADVKDTAWYAGYVNYCANREIVKGKTTTTFAPEDRITGYQVLAMILRTMGYGRNGEFEGPNWAINTAAQAKQLGIIDGVTENLLGSNATREFVAQILFKAMLTSKVDYNAIEGYKPNGTTLAKEKFGMERISGVVTGNEYADLENTSTMSDGKTRLKVGDTNYILNVTTDLTDIGESRFAYVVPDGKRNYNLVVDELYDTGLNVCAETGDAQSNVGSFARKDKGLSITSAEHFENFGYETIGESEWRIEYQVKFDNTKVAGGKTSQQWFADNFIDPADVLDAANRFDTVDLRVANKPVYTRVIARGSKITQADITIMKGIFSVADDDVHTDVGIQGYVYAGTAKQQNAVDKERDLSSEMKWVDFYDEYIVNKANTKISSTDNGEWLKIIDNNNDGAAEYVFATWYALAETTGYNSRYEYYTYSATAKENDGWVIDVNPIDGDDVNYGDYEPAVGDLVLAAWIDGKWQIEKAPMETKTIKTVSFKNETVTTTDGDEWDESEMGNWTAYADEITAMDEKVQYEIFFDHFNHIRAYRLVAGSTSYALLSELYYTNTQNGKFINTNTPIVEITIQDADTEELYVTNPKNNDFAGAGRVELANATYNWTTTDYLTRALNHLGTGVANPATGVGTSTANTEVNNKSQFNWTPDRATGTKNGVSETNVAVYRLTDDGVDIYGAAQYATNKRGEELYYSPYKWVVNASGVVTGTTAATDTSVKVNATELDALYRAVNGGVINADGTVTGGTAPTAAWVAARHVFATDYVQLNKQDLKKGENSYTMHKDDAAYNDRGFVAAGTAYQGNYVSAVHDTEYYLVFGDKVTYFTDYAELPKIDKNDITAMYAVAENTNADADKRDYWVANVVVIELNKLADIIDSVALAYYNPDKTSGTTKRLNGLDNMTEEPPVNLVPAREGWKGQWNNYGFYKLYDTEVETGEDVTITAGSIAKIVKGEYNKYQIFAGEVKREAKVEARGEYIRVNKYYDTKADEDLRIDGVPVYAIGAPGNSDKWDYYDLGSQALEAGQHIIWVKNMNGSAVKFVLITDYDGLRYTTLADWLYDADVAENSEYEYIMAEQNPADTRGSVTLTLNLVANETATITCDGETYTVTYPARTVTFKVPNTDRFEFTLKLANLAALVPNGDYTFGVAAGSAADEWIVTALKKSEHQILTAEKVYALGTAYTVDTVVAKIKDADKAIGATTTATTITAADADKLATELLDIVTNLVKGADAKKVTIGGAEKNLDVAIVDAVVKTLVNVAINKNPALANVKTTLEAAVTKAINDALKAGKSTEAIEEAVEAAIVAVAGPIAALDAAKKALKADIDAAKAKKLPDGVTAADAKTATDALNAAISAAEAALNAVNATVDSLKAAQTALAAAVKTYDDAIAALKKAADDKKALEDAKKAFEDYVKANELYVKKLNQANRNTVNDAETAAQAKIDTATDAKTVTDALNGYKKVLETMKSFLAGGVVEVCAARLWDQSTGTDDGGKSSLYTSYTIAVEKNGDEWDATVTVEGLKKHQTAKGEEGYTAGYAWILKKDAAKLVSMDVNAGAELSELYVEDTDNGVGELAYGVAYYLYSSSDKNVKDYQKDIVIVWEVDGVKIEVTYHTTTTMLKDGVKD